jgi:phosphopantothenate---cysteine ligase (CTP)
VRCITNVFSGRTGTRIALEAFARGHDVCMLTSHPDVIGELTCGDLPDGPRWRVRRFHTFADLAQLMEAEIVNGGYDAVIHVAAVSDYAVAGTYRLAEGSVFDHEKGTLRGDSFPERLVDASAGKVKSNHPELWLRLVPTPKLVDRIRSPWGFRGVLVKFKLEVDVGEAHLRQIAETSRRHSDADLVVANTLDEMDSWALIKARHDDFVMVSRKDLSQQVLSSLEFIATAQKTPRGKALLNPKRHRNVNACLSPTGKLVTCLRNHSAAANLLQSMTYTARATGLEPATTGSTVRYSNQLSYAPGKDLRQIDFLVTPHLTPAKLRPKWPGARRTRPAAHSDPVEATGSHHEQVQF